LHCVSKPVHCILALGGGVLLHLEKLSVLAVIGGAFFLGACAVDVISIRQTPTNFVAEPSAQILVLNTRERVPLVEGKSRALRAGTTWRKVGRITEGDVYETKDQVVTVDASNEHEAMLVVKDGMAVGFYLLVEHTFTAASKPIPFEATPR
jgi:hypothetical protein